MQTVARSTKVARFLAIIRCQLRPPLPRRVPEHRRFQPLAACGRGRWLYRCEGPRVSELQPPAVALERANLRAWSLLYHVSLLHHVRWWRSRLEWVAAAAAVSHVTPTRPPRVSRNVAHVLSWRHPQTPRLQLSFAMPRPSPHGLAREVCVMRTARWCRTSVSTARRKRNVVARCSSTWPRLPAVAAVAAGGLLCSTAAEQRRRVRSRRSLARSG